MTTSSIKKSLAVLLATAFVAATASVQAQTPPAAAGTTGTNAPAATHPKRERLIWSGTLTAVDKTAMTVTITKKEVEKTFQVTSETKIHKAGEPATLDDGVIGEAASASYRKTADTNAVPKAVSLRFGPGEKKPEPPASNTSTNKVQ
jgi:hypothetical protein